MASFNKVVLLGNLTRDPETKYTQSGTAVCSISLAINNSWLDKQTNQKREEVTYVEVDCWGRTAEIAGEYLRKGKPVLIEGRLKQETWVDKTTGGNRSKLKVVCESLQLLGGREGAQPGGGPAASEASESDHRLSAETAIAATEETPF